MYDEIFKDCMKTYGGKPLSMREYVTAICGLIHAVRVKIKDCPVDECFEWVAHSRLGFSEVVAVMVLGGSGMLIGEVCFWVQDEEEAFRYFYPLPWGWDGVQPSRHRGYYVSGLNIMYERMRALCRIQDSLAYASVAQEWDDTV